MDSEACGEGEVRGIGCRWIVRHAVRGEKETNLRHIILRRVSRDNRFNVSLAKMSVNRRTKSGRITVVELWSDGPPWTKLYQHTHTPLIVCLLGQ